MRDEIESGISLDVDAYLTSHEVSTMADSKRYAGGVDPHVLMIGAASGPDELHVCTVLQDFRRLLF
jgi:hypothetical protein